MSALYSRYNVALAQIAPRIGDLQTNLDKHLTLIEQAIQQDCKLILFPELSLTGYLLKDAVAEVAKPLHDSFFEPLKKLSHSITIVCGAVELSPDFILYNSALVFEDGELLFRYRKVYLPTYSIFEEKRFFGEGDRVRTFDSKLGRMGIQICNDMWHPTLLWLLALQGAELVLFPTASPLRGISEAPISDAQRVFKLLCETGSKTNTLYIALVNQVGWQDGIYFWGESSLFGPDGRPTSTAAFDREDLLITEVDRDKLRRERIAVPLRRDERMQLVARELEFIRSLNPDAPPV